MGTGAGAENERRHGNFLKSRIRIQWGTYIN